MISRNRASCYENTAIAQRVSARRLRSRVGTPFTTHRSVRKLNHARLNIELAILHRTPLNVILWGSEARVEAQHEFRLSSLYTALLFATMMQSDSGSLRMILSTSSSSPLVSTSIAVVHVIGSNIRNVEGCSVGAACRQTTSSVHCIADDALRSDADQRREASQRRGRQPRSRSRNYSMPGPRVPCILHLSTRSLSQGVLVRKHDRRFPGGAWHRREKRGSSSTAMNDTSLPKSTSYTMNMRESRNHQSFTVD
jgi:hypothetical protein